MGVISKARRDVERLSGSPWKFRLDDRVMHIPTGKEGSVWDCGYNVLKNFKEYCVDFDDGTDLSDIPEADLRAI